MAVRALRELDGRALGVGVLAALLVVAPTTALSIAVIDTDAENGAGPLSLVLIVVTLFGFGFGGHRVARGGVGLPVTHGAFVGLLTYALVQAVVLTGSAIVGREGQVRIVALAISALLASSAGMIGASLGVRRSDWYR